VLRQLRAFLAPGGSHWETSRLRKMSNKIFGFAEAHIQRSQPSLTQLRQPHAPKHPSVFLTVLGELHQSKLFELQYACINLTLLYFDFSILYLINNFRPDIIFEIVLERICWFLVVSLSREDRFMKCSGPEARLRVA
jgi:hypothetical protein